jgi:hypothetical protein
MVNGPTMGQWGGMGWWTITAHLLLLRLLLLLLTVGCCVLLLHLHLYPSRARATAARMCPLRSPRSLACAAASAYSLQWGAVAVGDVICINF